MDARNIAQPCFSLKGDDVTGGVAELFVGSVGLG